MISAAEICITIEMQPVDNSGTTPRKGPNFLLIVILAGIAIVLILIASFFTVDWEGHRIVPKAFGSHAHPTAQLVVSQPPNA